MRRVLKLPAYRRLLAAYALNELALAIASLALALLVYGQTHSAIGSAGYFLCAQFVPALLSPALVARLDRQAARRILPLLYTLEAALFLALAAVAGHFSLAPLLALSVLDGIVALAARSLARAATVSVTAPRGLLREGNAVANTAFSVCFMVGPAIGGAIVVAGGTVAAMLTNSGVFAVIAVTLLTATGLPTAVPEDAGAGAGRRLRAALAHAAHRPAIRTLLGLQAVALLFFTISIPVEVVFAQHSLHAGSGGYAAMQTGWGAGTIAGSAIYARWRGRSPRLLITLGAGALGIGFLVMAVAPTLAVAIAGGIIAGMGNGVEAVAARTTLQEHVEESWMAMMMSLNESMFQAVPGAGIVIGGALTSLTGPRVALAVAGAGALLITLLAWMLLTAGRIMRPLESPPREMPDPPREPDSDAASSATQGSAM